MEKETEQDSERPSTVLPEGKIFGTAKDDEFTIKVNGEQEGIFKRFEYLSMPFSVAGEDQMFRELLDQAEKEGTAFRDQLESDDEAMELVEQVYSRMEENPGFSRELLDTVLSDAYVDDNIIAEMDVEDGFEPKLGKFAAGWKHMSDFYGIEGLVGGDAEELNPFLEEGGSMVAGGLDSLETKLPAIRDELSDEEWNENLLKISSLVDRDYRQIDRGVDILELIHGREELGEDTVSESEKVLDELVDSKFESNADLGKFYNTYIRFHNWLPLKITSDGPEGDAYDSICDPASDALEMFEGSLSDSLSEIGDATSPKGLALTWMVDQRIEPEGKPVGDRDKLVESAGRFEDRIDDEIADRREQFEIMDYDDPGFYPGLTGGKWKGLKLLHDVKSAFDLDYKVPDAEVVTDIGVKKLLEQESALDVIEDNVFSMDESSRKEIQERIEDIDLGQIADDLESGMIARSSMYGEDGASNFAGTYESFFTDEDPEEAFRNVLSSYFSRKAVDAREDKGMTHLGGIGVIIQDKIDAKLGGVIHLTDEGYSISEAGNPEKAVEGRGNCYDSENYEGLLEGTSVEGLEDDLSRLHSVLGDIDIEYVSNGEETYITQLRPKHSIESDDRSFEADDTYVIDSLEDMDEADLNGDGDYVVRMNFLGRDNIMDREREIEEFLRQNQHKIAGVEGRMPSPAHIPNNIEGHFKIPYRQVED